MPRIRVLLLAVVLALVAPSPSTASLGSSPETHEKRRFARERPDNPLSPPTDSAQIQTIFWPDDRVQISPTTGFPWRAVVYLDVWAAGAVGGSSPVLQCSGIFIGPNVVLTASHCLYGPVLGGWASDVRVVPGKNGSVEPFGYTWADTMFLPRGWITGINAGLPPSSYAQYDRAIMIVERPSATS